MKKFLSEEEEYKAFCEHIDNFDTKLAKEDPLIFSSFKIIDVLKSEDFNQSGLTPYDYLWHIIATYDYEKHDFTRLSNKNS